MSTNHNRHYVVCPKGDKAPQLCSASHAGKGPHQYWLKSQSYRAAPASRCFVLTWGVSASLPHHSLAQVLPEDALDAICK
ncbi:hypothetical protein WJX77_009231 [Trebouxia sp. C0004]